MGPAVVSRASVSFCTAVPPEVCSIPRFTAPNLVSLLSFIHSSFLFFFIPGVAKNKKNQQECANSPVTSAKPENVEQGDDVESRKRKNKNVSATGSPCEPPPQMSSNDV
jgi:hypothetical protein